ncbi:MAG: TlyA family RNA methyltransferase [Candidatus Eremiobacteraeota bacterium]|nr:TlyA family RNA methyltransferase [Candidatus Eremiobacteraeota bacterium]
MTPPAQRLDEAVASRAGVTRSRARSLIIAGRVRVDGRPMTKPGTTVAATAALEVERPRPYVSRGGEKLEGALDDFALDVRGTRALDVGASTGGFTDCLLARGAAHVTALDVGYGQLAYELRTDSRVTLIERTNFRTLPDDAFAQPFDAIVADASFISIVTILGRAKAYLAPGGSIVALVKPQFEAGRERLGGGGVVRDDGDRTAILRETRDALVGIGLIPVAATQSKLRGPAGNIEAFFLVRTTGVPVSDGELERAAVDRR